MNARTATPGRAAERGAEGSRGKPQGRLVVSEYVGQTAAVAAQTIRRAGLRPGLERSFDCDPELVGQVVAQEPPAGSELARNMMVTLYVGAPGAVPDDESPDRQPVRNPAASSPVTAQASLPDDGVQHAKPRQRRRRKPGLAEGPSRVFDTPPAPVPPDADLALVAPTMLTDADPTEELVSDDELPRPGEPDRTEFPEGVLDDDGHGELLHDELVLHADDVFAGRAGVPRRRVYPARRRLTSSCHHDQRRWSR
jgi:hypothetical protein